MTGDDPTFIHGFDIPGDVGLGVYLRHHKRPEDSEGCDLKDKLFAPDRRPPQSAAHAHGARRPATEGTLMLDALVQEASPPPAGEPVQRSFVPIRFEMDTDKEKGLSKALCFIICIDPDMRRRR